MTKLLYGILILFILILGFLFQDPLRCFSQPFIERIINENPEAKIVGYLKVVMENDERKALKLWQLSDWKEDPLLSNRRQNVTEELIAMGIKDFEILDIEWWRTCCEPGVVNNPKSAGGARVRVQLKNQNSVNYIYIFDVFHREGSYWGDAEGCQLRHWVIRDVYLSDQKPLFWTFSSSKPSDITSIEEMIGNIVLYSNNRWGAIYEKSEKGIEIASLLVYKLRELNLQASCVFGEEDIQRIKEKNKVVELVFREPIDITISQWVEPEERSHIPVDEMGYRILEDVGTALFVLEDNLDEGLESHILIGHGTERTNYGCWAIKQEDSQELDKTWIDEVNKLIK